MCRIPGVDGRRVSDLVQLVDISPTITELLDVDPFECDGESLVPLMSGTDRWESREYVYAEEAHTQRRICVRSNRWKFIKHRPDRRLEEVRGDSFQCGYCQTVHGERVELYDLEEDPEETVNVASDHPEVVSSLEATFDDHIDTLAEMETQDGDVTYEHEEEVMDRLEELGYR